jgi:hypothetical protein
MTQVAVEIIEAPPVSVEIVETGGVQVVEIERPSQVEVVEIIHPGPQGPAAESAAIRVDAATAGIIYVGQAPHDSAESSPTWTVVRSLFDAAGVRTSKGQAVNVTWSGRATHNYS